MRKTFLKTLVATAVVGATVALSSAFAFAGTVIDSWSASDLEVVSATDSTISLGTNFTYTALTNKGSVKSKVTANSKTFTDGATFANRLQIGGKSSLSDGLGVFTFKAPSEGTLTIYAVTGSNTEGRTVELYDADGNKLKSWTTGPFEGDDSSAWVYIPFNYAISKAGTYTIASTGAAVNYYGMTFSPNSDLGLTQVSNGAVYVTDTDTYVIAGVDSADADLLSVTVGSVKTVTETTDTVYTAVQIGDTTITAEQVGKKYLYAIKLAGANKNKAAETFTVE